MKKEIVISEAEDLAVVFENGRAAEFVLRQGEQLVGDIVLGKVESVVPAIEAAFINIGHEKNGFIHVADLPNILSPRKRTKPQPIRSGEKLLVQIAKAPTGTKGARLTGRLSIPGRYLVFVPHDNRVCMSRMITDPRERERLRRIATDLKDPGHGLIVRTEAVNCTEEELRRDVEELIERWTDILHGAQMKAPPALLYRDNDLLTRVLRDRLTADTERIVVDTQDAYQRAKAMLSSWMPEMVRNLTVHRGRSPLMQHYRIAEEIESALKPKVNLPSGGSIVIEATEALTVIDVNSGKLTSSRSLQETVLKTNIEAAAEIARQIRLRDIGGIIIVDFISMDFPADRQKVLAAMNEAIKSDKSRPQITSQFSEHGLMELSRRRQGQSLLEQLTKLCPTCLGLGRLRNEVLPSEHEALPSPKFEARAPKTTEEAAGTIVEELLEEPVVVEAPTYPGEGPRVDMETEEESEERRRRRRRRGRRGRGRGAEEAPGMTATMAGPAPAYEEEEEEAEVEEVSAPGFAFEPMELETFEARPSEERYERAERGERPERGERGERGGRERGRRGRGGRDRSERGERGERFREERAAAPVSAPVTEAWPAQPTEPAGPSPWGEAAAPAAVAEPAVEAPVRVFRPKSRPRPKMAMVEVAPGVMQLVPVEEAEAMRKAAPEPEVAPAEIPAPEAEAPVEVAAPEAPVEEAAAEPVAEAPAEEAAAPAEEVAPVRKTARRRPVKGRATKAAAEAPEAEAPAEVPAPEAPVEAAAAPAEAPAEEAAETEAPAEEATEEEAKPARRAPARRRSTRTRKTTKE